MARISRHQQWLNFKCSFLGHEWVSDGPKTWSATCSRCGDHYHLAKVVA